MPPTTKRNPDEVREANRQRLALAIARKGKASPKSKLRKDLGPYPLVDADDPTLYAVAREVPEEMFDSPELITIAARLLATVEATGGLAVAAPQVGVDLRIWAERGGRVYCNPLVTPVDTPSRPRPETEEGCLSLPESVFVTSRATSAAVSWMDVYGEHHTELRTGLRARVAQHEVEHLDGILLPDSEATLRGVFADDPADDEAGEVEA